MRLRRPRRGERERGPRRRATALARLRERARRADVRGRAGKLWTPLAAGLGEVLAIGREMLAIPASIALGLAERLGLGILAVLRFGRPIALAALRTAKRGIDIAATELTPARAIAAAALAAALFLCVSQFLDYREVRAGVPAYADVEQVAPAPRVEGTAHDTGSAHGYALVLVGLGAGALTVLSMLGRWRLARLLFPLGLAAVAVAILIDVPAGLDEGMTAVEFEGAEARLLGPFWVQLASAAVIALCGPMLALQLRPGGARRAPGGARERRGAIGGSRVQGARP